MIICPYKGKDIEQITEIWNEIVDSAIAFPKEEILKLEKAREFFAKELAVICACEEDKISGFYVLHPNGYGRCSHICNTSYGVRADAIGHVVGRKLALDSFKKCKEYGFKILQYNNVVSINENVLKLYLSLNMTEAGKMENGYRLKDGSYCDGIIFTK